LFNFLLRSNQFYQTSQYPQTDVMDSEIAGNSKDFADVANITKTPITATLRQIVYMQYSSGRQVFNFSSEAPTLVDDKSKRLELPWNTRFQFDQLQHVPFGRHSDFWDTIDRHRHQTPLRQSSRRLCFIYAVTYTA